MSSESITYGPSATTRPTEDRGSNFVRVRPAIGYVTTQSVESGLSRLSDEALLNQLNEKSKDALAVLFRRHRGAVLSVAWRILKDASEAEDLCQEVFLFLFERAKLFDPKKGSGSSWIIQIAYHRAMNRRKYLACRQHYDAQELNEDLIEGSDKPSLIDGIDAKRLLGRLREQLSPEQRQALELHFFEGYTLREIAAKLEDSYGNIRHHYYRGLERLRALVMSQKER